MSREKTALPKLPTSCPSCSALLAVSRLTCPQCHTQVDGQFDLHELLRLSPDELAFIVAFVRASGSLKQMAKLKGQSYPTIRNQLNEIIAKLNESIEDRESVQNRILDAVARGEVSVAEALAQLKTVAI